jgi:hypothetical protein
MGGPSPPPRPRFRWSDATFLALALVLLAGIGAGLAWAFLSDGDTEVVRSPPTRPPATAASPSPTTTVGEGSCGPVQEVPPYESEPGDRAHAQVPLSTYPSIPPTSGPHDSVTLPSGSYSEAPPIGRVLHSLEHGAVVIWFEPSVASSQPLQEIREFMGPAGPGLGVHIIIAPYDFPGEGEAGRLPSGVTMAVAAWHRLQLCTRIDADTLRSAADFVLNYRCPPRCNIDTYRGEAPEAGAPI